uniref:Very long-chain fatty acid transport protein n=1 Tax=Tabanus bromius TaxID=304241 RepID=A0A0K8TSP3_TABBR
MLLELDFKKRNLTLLGITLTGLFVGILLNNRPISLAVWLGTMAYLLTGKRPQTIYAIVVTFPRDIRTAVRFVKLNLKLMIWERQKKTIPKVFRDFVRLHPDKIAFMMDDKKLTFQEVEDLSNEIASYFKSKNFAKGDTIALLMGSRTEYPCIWLGLSKIGVITALINSNLRKETLTHSIKAANSKAIIVETELIDAINDIKGDEGVKGLPIFEFHDSSQKSSSKLEGTLDLLSEIEKHQKVDINEDIAKSVPRDKMVYIYTSGTTGMPKAAVITNLRYMFMCLGVKTMLGINDDDVVYNPLPLYHTAGGMIGVGTVLLCGVTMVIRRKFSASNFWPDCIKYKCTVAQYIGEICRYLLSVPGKPTDTQHNIRLMFGNGLRPQIWPQFVSRFNIPQIGEVYGSTEGNSNLVNCENQIGAIGFVPLGARKLYPVCLIKCDEATGEPIRDENGRCIRCKPGEPGVFIGKINPKRALSSFSGYADKRASEKKVVKDVFKEGDAYFNSGDILVTDILGYYYFKDRTGDTFRWRGENVATSEVEAVISNVVGLQDCVVYGVEIPHVEGKAGMAAIVDPEKKVDFEELSVGIRGSLPPYARPLFVRIMPAMPMTGTFKLKKRDLQLEGFDLHKIKDPIYYLGNDGIYREFTEKDLEAINEGKARL